MRRLFFNNVGMKLFALAFALVVWAAVQMQINKGWRYRESIDTRVFTQVPVFVMQSPADKNVYELIPSQASVELSGPRQLLRKAPSDILTLYVSVTPEDVRKASCLSDTNIVQIIKKLEYKIPPDFTLLKQVPASVRVTTKPVLETNIVEKVKRTDSSSETEANE